MRRGADGGSRQRVSAVLSVTAAALLAGCGGGAPAGTPTSAPTTSPSAAPSSPGGTGRPPVAVTGADTGPYRLVFADEFDGPARSKPDPARWGYDVGAGGWGNEELQRYTDFSENASLDGQGALRIVARDKGADAPDRYTSARLTTESTFRARYGRFEARMRLPAGAGLWPAFWLNGECGRPWPDCGEIDVMESVDEVPRTVRGRIHGPGPSYRAGFGGDWQVRSRLDEGFHVYGVEWTPTRVVFTFDGREYARVDKSALPPDDVWALDHDAHLILNVAVGGRWPGSPTARTRFPAALVVDWVRVYQRG